MPKEREHFGSSERRYHPFTSSSSRSQRHSFSQNSPIQNYCPSASSSTRHSGQSFSGNPPESASAAVKDIKPATTNRKITEIRPTTEHMREWDEVRCPACMEQPHNAILLICTSHDKGCRPFMCDTSHRHSNCFDQFRKTFCKESQRASELCCPLCRGQVTGWKVLQPARKYLNTKVRSCAWELCQFSGAYEELRKHARREHPDVRPLEVDLERQRDWRRMEEEQDSSDLLSTMQWGIVVEELEYEFVRLPPTPVHLGDRGLLTELEEGMLTNMDWGQGQDDCWLSLFFSDVEEGLPELDLELAL